MKMIKNLVSKINYCHIIWFFFFLILLIFTIPEAVNIGQRIINSFICFGKNMWIYFYFIFVGDYPDIAINGSWMFIDTNSDLINGILPIELNIEADLLDDIDVCFDDKLILVKNISKNKKYSIVNTLTKEEMNLINCGGLLNTF